MKHYLRQDYARNETTKSTKAWRIYRIELMFNGKRISATRDTEKECEQWAMLKLLELKTEQNKNQSEVKQHYPFSALLHKYYEEIGRHKKSSRTIRISIKQFIDSYPVISQMSVHDITPQILTDWRNSRLKRVSIGTVLRDISLFSAIFTYAQKELFLIESNPFSMVSKPSQPKSRNRRISDAEIDLVLKAHNYERGQVPTEIQHFIAWAWFGNLHFTNGEEFNCDTEFVLRLSETKTLKARQMVGFFDMRYS